MRAIPTRPKSPLWICLTLSLVYLTLRYLTTPSPSSSSSSLNQPQHSRQSRTARQSSKSLYPRPLNQSQFGFLHARESARRLIPYSPAMHSWRKNHQDELARLIGCKNSLGRHRSCTPSDKNIILLGTVHFSRVLDGLFSQKASFPAGEAIWADAFMWALNQLEYPFLVVTGADHNETNTRLGEVYELLGPDVKMVIGDYLSIPQCLHNKACVESNDKPLGIPPHKLFIFDGFGQDVGHPLGRKWHLTFYPQEEKNYTYLGLTIEHYCHKFGVVPAQERSNKIYILGKDRSYLHAPSPTLYPETMWQSLANKTGVQFTIGTQQKEKLKGLDSRALEPKDQLFDGIIDIGSQARDKFIYELQHHKAVIGLGWPVQPSTALEALCVGTPFINPVWNGRRSQPDRSKWHSQHPYLARFDPPYVYNVQDHREDDVQAAIEQLLKSPLDKPFIPDEMKKEAYLNRVDQLVKFDWQSLALAQSSSSSK
ncbi:hypothetical protein PGT21_010077 [Puccinia graminis f. sp. tritici]|uniref:alpha-1,6-mannosyl-glycoprotein 6-beta-N-acetylglucosaminyltransferase n=1 Tax=Puccinia graminis f. sp. tritici TaxID=56615 RepID=A0A5B0LQL1_PUCGR|nr:hypothetical protein PGTUg99_030079 [Puccinia graminis f. sp. tritici]KAA1071504.1 hypothetical protein PGT21_010077 [Puccinia graminis f. sp. tritici]